MPEQARLWYQCCPNSQFGTTSTTPGTKISKNVTSETAMRNGIGLARVFADRAAQDLADDEHRGARPAGV